MGVGGKRLRKGKAVRSEKEKLIWNSEYQASGEAGIDYQR
jgi:hypothetical protein